MMLLIFLPYHRLPAALIREGRVDYFRQQQNWVQLLDRLANSPEFFLERRRLFHTYDPCLTPQDYLLKMSKSNEYKASPPKCIFE